MCRGTIRGGTAYRARAEGHRRAGRAASAGRSPAHRVRSPPCRECRVARPRDGRCRNHAGSRHIARARPHTQCVGAVGPGALLTAVFRRNLSLLRIEETAMTNDTRTEKDPLGPLPVPNDALYGVQTVRAL